MAKDVERSQDLLRLVNIGPRRRNGVSSQTLWAPNSNSPEPSPPGPSPSSLHKNTPWAETLPIPCPRRQGADERHCSDDAVTLREPRSVSLRPGSPRLSVDPTSGHRAQLSMRTSLLSGLALLAACGGGVQPPELVPPGPLPTAPAAPGAAPGPGPITGPAHRALIAADWALAGRAQAVAAPHAMVVSSHPLASEVGTDILRRGGNAVDAAVAVGFALAVVHPVAGNIGGGG